MNSALFLQRELSRRTRTQSHNTNMDPRPSSVADTWTAIGSTIASLMFFWAIIRQYCPQELRRFLERHVIKFTSLFNPYMSIYIHEYSSTRLKRSKIYSSVEAYLTKNSTKSAKRLKAELAGDSKKIVYSMEEYEKVTDEFQGIKIWWSSGKSTSTSQTQGMGFGYYREPDKRYYKITFHNKYREMITERYLDHVLNMGKEIRIQNRQRKLYTNGPARKWSDSASTWSHIPFEHPATFANMAMEMEKKEDIMDDLISFSASKEYYAQVGKAWKRGYLLYGPPGTGKSTMIAAMANLLHYDVYDLELTAVKDNTELRKLLIDTTSKSIIVIEDIDCSLDLTGQRKKKPEKSEEIKKDIPIKDPKEESINNSTKVTLSGLLNFIDGLWSASGGERIIVFTTNHVEKLDPALIRRGRMDKHIELSYCSFEGFKVFAKNYLKIDEHVMFGAVEKLMGEVRITPADVAENLMCKSKREDADTCLSNLIRALEEAKKAAAEKKVNQELKLKERKGESQETVYENGIVSHT